MHKYFLISIRFILISFKAHTVETKLDDLPTETIAYITGSLPIADCAALRQTNKRNSQIISGHALKKRFLNEKVTEINKAKELIHQYMEIFSLTMTDTGMICHDVAVLPKYEEKYKKNAPPIFRTMEGILDSTIATTYLVETCEAFSWAYKAQKRYGLLPPKKVPGEPERRKKGSLKPIPEGSYAWWYANLAINIAVHYSCKFEANSLIRR